MSTTVFIPFNGLILEHKEKVYIPFLKKLHLCNSIDHRINYINRHTKRIINDWIKDGWTINILKSNDDVIQKMYGLPISPETTNLLARAKGSSTAVYIKTDISAGSISHTLNSSTLVASIYAVAGGGGGATGAGGQGGGGGGGGQAGYLSRNISRAQLPRLITGTVGTGGGDNTNGNSTSISWGSISATLEGGTSGLGSGTGNSGGTSGTGWDSAGNGGSGGGGEGHANGSGGGGGGAGGVDGTAGSSGGNATSGTPGTPSGNGGGGGAASQSVGFDGGGAGGGGSGQAGGYFSDSVAGGLGAAGGMPAAGGNPIYAKAGTSMRGASSGGAGGLGGGGGGGGRRQTAGGAGGAGTATIIEVA